MEKSNVLSFFFLIKRLYKFALFVWNRCLDQSLINSIILGISWVRTSKYESRLLYFAKIYFSDNLRALVFRKSFSYTGWKKSHWKFLHQIEKLFLIWLNCYKGWSKSIEQLTYPVGFFTQKRNTLRTGEIKLNKQKSLIHFFFSLKKSLEGIFKDIKIQLRVKHM